MGQVQGPNERLRVFFCLYVVTLTSSPFPRLLGSKVGERALLPQRGDEGWGDSAASPVIEQLFYGKSWAPTVYTGQWRRSTGSNRVEIIQER